MPSGWASWLGVFGFGIAILAVFLQWLQYRWSRRSFREQREERVSVRAVYNPALGDTRPTWVLQVHVVNTGMVPVYVKSVGLSYFGRAVLVPQRGPGENPIASGDERYHALSGDAYDSLEDIATLPRSSVSLDDKGPEGRRIVELDPTRGRGLSSEGSVDRGERDSR